MTENEFRKFALGMPEVTESAHMGHPDFRVGGKIFATLGAPRKGWGMVKLTPLQQKLFAETHPEIFVPVNGAWGRGGATYVELKSVSKKAARKALEAAWCNTAPAKLTKAFDSTKD